MESEIMKQGYFMYLRKSSESDDRQMESIPAQLKILKNLVASKDLTVFKTFEESKSAKAPNERRQFNKMVELIEEGGAKGIICWKLNRLSRNPVDTGKLQWMLQQGKIEEIVTPNKTYTDFDSDLVMGVEGAMANKFIRDLREDTKRGIDRKLEAGLAPILAPAGYINDKDKPQGQKTISPHPEYFNLVREIFNLALTGNFSVQKLHEEARRMGIKNNLGKDISRTQMYRLLTNPFYKGGFKYAGNTYDGVHKPMISDEEYDIIQEHLKERSRPTRESKHEWTLTGLIKCGLCDRQITAEQHVKKSGLVFCYYKCTGKYRYKCPQAYVPSEELEQQAYDYLGKIKLSTRFVEWAIKVLKRATDDEKEKHYEKFKHIRAEHDRVDESIYNLKMKWATTNEIDDKFYYREVDKLKGERRKLYKKLENEDKDFDQTTDITIATFKFARDAQRRWEEKDAMYKRGIMKVVGSSLVLNKKGKLKIKPRTPFLLIEKALKNEARVQPTLKYQYVRLNQESEPNAGSEDFKHTVVGG